MTNLADESKFKKYGVNTKGKDYICGDIHGHFHLLHQELENHNFDPTSDRVFCLGDLIDRGDDSSEVVSYLQQPWFHSVLGNHEQMLIDAIDISTYEHIANWLSQGGSWAKEMSRNDLLYYYEPLTKLPLTIEIELSSGKNVGLVHANLPKNADWLSIRFLCENFSIHNPYRLDSNAKEMLWSRKMHKSIGYVKNINHVFHGHTIVDKVKTINNRSYIDLGSYNTKKIGFFHIDNFLSSLEKQKQKRLAEV